jgi:hypothetical protein
MPSTDMNLPQYNPQFTNLVAENPNMSEVEKPLRLMHNRQHPRTYKRNTHYAHTIKVV